MYSSYKPFNLHIVVTKKLAQVVTSFAAMAGITICLSLIPYYYFHRQERRRRRDKRPLSLPWLKGFQNLMVMLGDTHLISALAIIITSHILVARQVLISPHHIYVARALTELNLIAHLAAVTFIGKPRHNWVARLIFLGLLLLLLVSWNALVLSPLVPCYGDNWVYFTMNRALTFPVWDSAGAPWCYYQITQGLWRRLGGIIGSERIFLVKSLGKPDSSGPRRKTRARIHHSLQTVKQKLELSPLSVSLGVQTIQRAALNHWRLSAYVPPLFLLIQPQYSWGQLGYLFVYFVITASIYYERQSAIEHAVETPPPATAPSAENDWAFGQILPMLMMILPVLSVLDRFAGGRLPSPTLRNLDQVAKALFKVAPSRRPRKQLSNLQRLLHL